MSAKGCGTTAANSSQQRQAAAKFDVSPNLSSIFKVFSLVLSYTILQNLKIVHLVIFML